MASRNDNDLARIISEAVTNALRQSRTSETNVAATSTSTPNNEQQRGGRQRVFTTSAPVPLPSSFLDRQVELPPVRKRRRATEPRPKIHTKNVVCLPPMSGPNCTIPRGETRAKLVENGLVAKMSFESTWDETRIDAEIYGLFHHLFESEGCNEIFSFQYLSSLPGAKKLCIPRTSALFHWNAKEVLSICVRDTLYIASEQFPHSVAQKHIDAFLENSQEEMANCDEHQAYDHNGSCSAGVNVVEEISSYEGLVIEDEIEISDDEELPAVFTQSSDKHASLASILSAIRSNEIDENARSFINVRRSQLWVDSCRHITKSKFNPKAVVSIKFADYHGSSEGAVDMGGPRREYFRLLIRAVNLESGIFCGPEDNRIILPNATARSKGLYKLVGKIIAWSLVHGGPGCYFFSKTLYDTIAFNGTCRSAYLEDIADKDIYQKISTVKNAATLEELNTGLRQPAIEKNLDAQGALPSASSISQKDSICDLLVRHILIDSVEFLINEMKEGLNTLGVLQSIQNHPCKFKELFSRENLPKLDAQMVDLIFVPKLDEEGSNQRAAQEQAVVYWRDYLQDCMDGDSKASLQEVLIFATGASVPPPMGFDNKPSLEFVEGVFPKANTCAPVLYLPLGHHEFNQFKEKMDFGILNSPCFGYA